MKMLRSIFILVLFISLLSISCSRSDDKVQIPEYPGAIDDQEHDAKMLGVSMAKVKRVFTSDSFDKVFAFYNEKLAQYGPEIMSYALEDGRQAAFTIKKGNVTVAVQEFIEEGAVAITYMGTGF
jgi:hypothetical protein